MNEETLLLLLKMDLRIMTDKTDEYLLHLISTASDFIKRTGVTLMDTAEDTALVVMRAAYLYRYRQSGARFGEVNAALRMFQLALNNRLFSEKAGGEIG